MSKTSNDQQVLCMWFTQYLAARASRQYIPAKDPFSNGQNRRANSLSLSRARSSFTFINTHSSSHCLSARSRSVISLSLRLSIEAQQHGWRIRRYRSRHRPQGMHHQRPPLRWWTQGSMHRILSIFCLLVVYFWNIILFIGMIFLFVRVCNGKIKADWFWYRIPWMNMNQMNAIVFCLCFMWYLCFTQVIFLLVS